MCKDSSTDLWNCSRFCIGTVFLLWSLSLAMRLGVYQGFSQSPFRSLPWVDEASYYNWAKQIHDGNLILDHPYFQDPLYPHTLAVWMFAVGDNVLDLRWISAVFSSLITPLTFLATRLLLDKNGCLAATFLSAVYLPAIQFSVLLLKPNLVIIILTILIWTYARFLRYVRLRDAFALGLACGAASLLRGNFLLVLPFLLVWVYWFTNNQDYVSSNRTPKAIRNSVVFSIGLFFFLSLSLLHNWLASRQWILTTSQAGMVFHLGNNEEATGGFSNPSWATAVEGIEHRQFVEEARRRTDNPDMTQAESSRYWFNQSMLWIVNHPRDWLTLCKNKLIVFCGRPEHSDNHYYELIAKRFFPWVHYVTLRWDLLLVMGTIGLSFPVLRPGAKGVLIGTGFLLFISMIIFYPLARYRMILVPSLLVLSGLTIQQFIVHLRNHSWKPCIWRIIFIAIPISAVSWGFFGQLQPGLSHALLTFGSAYASEGNRSQRDHYFHAALFFSPEEQYNYRQLRNRYLSDHERSQAVLTQPLASAPLVDWIQWIHAYKNTHTLFSEKDLRTIRDAAYRINHADLFYELAVIQAFHHDSSKHTGRTVTQVQNARINTAQRYLQQALRCNPDHPLSLTALGAMMAYRGDFLQAQRLLKQAEEHSTDPFPAEQLRHRIQERIAP